MTVRDSRTQARARTPGAEDDPTSTTVRDRALGPTQCGISDVATKGHEGRMQTKHLPVYAGSSLKLAMSGKAPSEMSALQPYRGKPAVRNDRGDRGNVGIIEARSAPRSYPTGRSCANSGHYKPLFACFDRTFVNPLLHRPRALFSARRRGVAITCQLLAKPVARSA